MTNRLSLAHQQRRRMVLCSHAWICRQWSASARRVFLISRYSGRSRISQSVINRSLPTPELCTVAIRDESAVFSHPSAIEWLGPSLIPTCNPPPRRLRFSRTSIEVTHTLHAERGCLEMMGKQRPRTLGCTTAYLPRCLRTSSLAS